MGDNGGTNIPKPELGKFIGTEQNGRDVTVSEPSVWPLLVRLLSGKFPDAFIPACYLLNVVPLTEALAIVVKSGRKRFSFSFFFVS